MSHRWGLVLLLFLVMGLAAAPAQALGIVVDTEIPEYILDDHIDLTGTYHETLGVWSESTIVDFGKGMSTNLTPAGSELALNPRLDVVEANNNVPILREGTGSAWDLHFANPWVIKVGAKYYFYYSASRGADFSSDWSIGLATSDDGITWTKYGTGPVVRSRVEWYDYLWASVPVVLEDKGNWYMWYSGNHGTSSLKDVDICLATSKDGYNWTKHPDNPVLTNSVNANAFDGTDVRVQSVLKEGNTFKLYFFGDKSATTPNEPLLGLATSTDGSNWTKHSGNPLYKAGNGWEGGDIHFGTIEAANGTYRMWTSSCWGPGMEVGYVTSDDGLDWEDSGSAVISPMGSTYYSKNLRWPSVVDEGDHMLLYAFCQNTNNVWCYGVFKLTPQRLDGVYTSLIKDVGFIATIGNVSWWAVQPNGTRVDVQVRHGNATSTLSPWRKLARGDELDGVDANFVQYRVGFSIHRDWQEGLRFQSFRLEFVDPVVAVMARVGDGKYEDVGFGNGNWSANLTLQDGNYVIDVVVTTASGGFASRTIPVKVDLLPPTGTILIEEGMNSTNKTSMEVRMDVRDTHGVLWMMLSQDPGFTGAEWVAYQPLWTVDLESPSEGEVTLYARFRDVVGRESDTLSDSIYYDKTPPTGTIRLDGGAAYTAGTQVRVSLDVEDSGSGVASMRVSPTGNFSGVPWQPYEAAFDWPLGPGDGRKELHVQVRDAAGNVLEVETSVIRDTTPPDGYFHIGMDEEYVLAPQVTLYVTASDVYGVADMRVSASPDLGDVEWVPFTTEVQWDLGTQEGEVTVHMEIRDRAGNVLSTSRSTVLDLHDPAAAITLNGGDEATLLLGARAVWSATDEVGLVRAAVSTSPTFADADWLPLKGARAGGDEVSVSLPGPEGLMTVYLRVEDSAGRVTTVSDDIWYVQSRPQGGLKLGDGSGWTRDPRVLVSVEWTGGSEPTHYRLALTPEGVANATWTDLLAQVLLDLPALGVNIVHAQLLGPHNVTSLPMSQSITMDGDPPYVTIVSPSLESTKEESVNLELTFNDDLDDAPSVRWRLNGGEWLSYSGPVDVTLREGRNVIEVEARDKANNSAEAIWEGTRESELFVSGSLMVVIVLVVLVVAGVLGFVAVSRRRGEEEEEAPVVGEREALARVAAAARTSADLLETSRKDEWVESGEAAPAGQLTMEAKVTEAPTKDVAALWAGIVAEAPAAQVDKEALRLDDLKRRYQNTIGRLPYGIPSPELQPWDWTDLASALATGEKRTVEGGLEVTSIEGRWYYSDMGDTGTFLKEHGARARRAATTLDRETMLAKLEERLVLGEISEETYERLRRKYEEG